jgi:DNA polymerase-1
MDLDALVKQAAARIRAESHGQAAANKHSGTNAKVKVNVRNASGKDKAVPYTYVTDHAGLKQVCSALEKAELVAIDLETTGLDPRADRIRLLSLATPNNGIYLVDAFTVDIKPLFPVMVRKTLVAHNAAFDLSFLAALGLEPGKAVCTMLLAQLLDGTRQPGGAAWPKGYFGLAGCCERELGRRLDKEQQKSDWSGALADDQLAYAATDAEVLLPLHQALMAKIKAAGMEEVAELESRALPAVVALSAAGVAVNRGAWTALAGESEADRDRLVAELAATAPTKPEGGAWNWKSPVQVKRVFELAGVELENTKDETLATVTHPLATVLRGHRAATKRADTYGHNWLKHVAADGRVRADWRQLGADTGRMSCSKPGLQQLPRDRRYRGCFEAGPGSRFVGADYSLIELRLAAKAANDRRMIDALQRGEDLHRLTAGHLLGKDPDEVTDDERRLGKTANFALIYGCSVKRLALLLRTQQGIEISQGQAEEYRAAFFNAWPGIAKWHERLRVEAYRAKMRQHCKGTGEVRTLVGRRILMTHEEWYGRRANAIVQGSGGDVIKTALAILRERRHEVPGARVVLVVHDEIVVECAIDQVEAVKAWLERAMIDALAQFIDPVPAVIEVATGRTWALDDAEVNEPVVPEQAAEPVADDEVQAAEPVADDEVQAAEKPAEVGEEDDEAAVERYLKEQEEALEKIRAFHATGGPDGHGGARVEVVEEFILAKLAEKGELHVGQIERQLQSHYDNFRPDHLSQVDYYRRVGRLLQRGETDLDKLRNPGKKDHDKAIQDGAQFYVNRALVNLRKRGLVEGGRNGERVRRVVRPDDGPAPDTIVEADADTVAPPIVVEADAVAPPIVVEPAVVEGAAFHVERADALDFLKRQPPGSIDLVFGSPPYEDARTYDMGFGLSGQAWVDWMVEVYRAATQACHGLVALVVNGRTGNFRWSATPALLLADLHRAGLNLRVPPIFHRVGIPGSGGPDWLRVDCEFVVCVTPPGRLSWSDPTACGQPPKYAPGGRPSHRRADGSRVNRRRAPRGYAEGDMTTAKEYKPPKLANPGNVIRCAVGGGRMGSALAHENEAPFPESLAEFFVKSFCPPGGLVCDVFSGSGTTAKVALANGRRFLGCDLRESQVELTRRRVAEIAQGAPFRLQPHRQDPTS